MEPLIKPKTFIVTDTHFFHKRLCEYAGRPEDFTKQIMSSWQKLVATHDTVIHLGDVQIGRMSQFGVVQDQLPGTKILIVGNHDYEKPQWYLNRGFNMVCHSMSIGKRGQILLTHRPLIPLPEHFDHNIHGHFHRMDDRRLLTDHTQEGIDYYHAQGDRYALLEIESTLAPVLLEDFCAAHNIKL